MPTKNAAATFKLDTTYCTYKYEKAENMDTKVLEQRPVYGTYGDLNIPTPQVVPTQEVAEDPEDLDLADTEFDDLMTVARPSTPMPDSDSDSESDGEPVYASSQTSEQLSRREMEAMGIYDDEEYEYESEDE
ncbi:hypothetical protein RSOL_225300, partial [Rhizoctonia solani AG-3 Rhs1AP]